MKSITREEMDVAMDVVLKKMQARGVKETTLEVAFAFSELVNRELFGQRLAGNSEVSA